MAADHDDDLYIDDRQHPVYNSHDGDHNDADGATPRYSFDTSTTTDTSTEASHEGNDEDHHEQDNEGSHDQYNEHVHEEDGNQIGRAVTTSTYQTATHRSPRISSTSSSPRISSASSRQRPRDSHVGSPHFRSYSAFKNDMPTTPPSRRASLRSSRVSTPTTFVPSKRDRLRYSWQSIYDEDEPGKPRIHVIKIVSTASTSAAGIGQEEAFGFSCSNRGKRIAVYNSARLFILQTAALPVNVSQEYALKRRPLAVEIVDDENILAVLADEHTINVYDLSHQRVSRIKTIRPDHPTYTIALSSTGALIAAAYEGGVEIFSLAPHALSTDRRAIRSPRMDKLSFSDDGSALLGTTTRLHASSTVVVSVPVFPSAASGVPSHEELKEAWCSGLLNPENIRNSSHATFWRDRGRLCNEKLFAWDGLEDTFSVLNTTDLEYSNISCPIGVSQPLAAVGGLGAAIHSVPSVDEFGTSVAMIVNHTTVRIYTIPQNVSEDEQRVEAHSLDHELNEEYGCPFAEARWVHTHKNFVPPTGSEPRTRGRLIVTSPGGVFDAELAEQTVQDIEGGRIIIFDFDPQYAGQPGQIFTFTLGKAPPLELGEEDLDVATEVDLVRRRTITKNRIGTLGQRPPSLGRTATTMSRRREYRLRDEASLSSLGRSSSVQNTPIQEYPPHPLFSHLRGSRRPSLSLTSLSSEASRSLPDLLEGTELAYEEPYTQAAPRSGTSIQRAATNANYHRFQALEERAAELTDPEGVPLPTYSEVPNQPLPAKFRKLAGLDIPQTGRLLYHPETATAPPVFSSNYHNIPRQSTFPQAPPSLPHPSFARNPQSAYSDDLTHAASVLGTGPPPPLIGDWNNVSPLATRLPTTNLRHQSSWETVTTAQGGNPQYPNSQASHSPISRTTTRTTLRSQRSFEMRSPPLQQGLGSPLFQQSNLDDTTEHANHLDSSILSGANGTRNISGDLRNSFRVSLLLPSDSSSASFSPVEPRPPSAASTTVAHGSSTDYPLSQSIAANRNFNPEASPHHAVPVRQPRQTPFQRVGAISSGLRSPGGGPGVGVSAGGVPHPVTNWYPPAPSNLPPSSSLPALPSSSGSTTASLPPVPPLPSSSGHSTIPYGSAGGAGSAGASLRSISSAERLRDPYIRAHSAPLTRSSTATTTTTNFPAAENTRTGSRLAINTISAEQQLSSTSSFGKNSTPRPGINGKRSKSVGHGGRMFSSRKAKLAAANGAAGSAEPDPFGRERVIVKTREEFREIEGQGKRCVMM